MNFTNGRYLAKALDDFGHLRLPCEWRSGSVYGTEISDQYVKIGSENGPCTYKRYQLENLTNVFEFTPIDKCCCKSFGC